MMRLGSLACYALSLALLVTAVIKPISFGGTGHWELYPFILFAYAAGTAFWTQSGRRDPLDVGNRVVVFAALLVLLIGLRMVGGQ